MASITPEPKPGTVTTANEPDGLAEAAAAAGASPELLAGSMPDYVRIWLKRIRSGESGALPVVVGLVAVVVFFQIKNSLFLSAGNLVNLMTQASYIIALAMAEIFVLLLGEIDLAAGYTAGCGAVVVLWMIAAGWPWWVAVLVGLAACAAYGALQGLIITFLRLPSFVVTLAGLLFLSGLILTLINAAGPIGLGGVIELHSNVINDLEAGSLNPVASWIVMIAAVVVVGGLMVMSDRRRRVSGLVAPPVSITWLKIAVMAIAGAVVVAVANINRGIGLIVLHGLPWVVLVVLGILVVYSILLGRTRFGRYVYAIGGNAEAARRAGINLSKIRIIAFALCGMTAGIAGVFYASFLGSISNDIPGGSLVLDAVAAAVIGGTSLFGGRGKIVHALLGGLVVGVIYNGLELLGLSAPAQLMWTAVVLLAAVVIDSVTRRGRVTT